MASKRMFDKKVVGSDKFIDLPNSSKALYFMAGMEADDKGFFQPRKLQRMCGFSDDDYKILIAKGFFITFDSGVMVVTDWNKNNWLDSRRVTETEYIDELNMLKLVNQKYEFRLENDDAKQMLSQYSIEENSIEENSIEENSIYNTTDDIEENSLFDFLQENGFQLTPIQIEVVQQWEDNELTRYAIKKAVLNNIYKINYIDKILYSYKVNNITTVQQAIESDEEYNKKRDDFYKIKYEKKETSRERQMRLVEEMCKDD